MGVAWGVRCASNGERTVRICCRFPIIRHLDLSICYCLMGSTEHMSEEAHIVAMPSGDDLLPRVSSLPKEADTVVILSGEGVPLGDSSQSQQQEITVDHGTHISIDELLKVIKGSSGMPVLFVPSSDGRLAAVAVDGLQNLMPANPEGSVSNEIKEQNFRSWLLLLTSLVATVTFTAGLTPPGGFWSADDEKNKKYVASDPVMVNKSPSRYMAIYTSNTIAFFTSLMIITSLAKNRNREKIMTFPFTLLVVFCFLSLGSAYISGTWLRRAAPFQLGIVVAQTHFNIFYMTLDWIHQKCSSIIQQLRGSPESVAQEVRLQL